MKIKVLYQTEKEKSSFDYELVAGRNTIDLPIEDTSCMKEVKVYTAVPIKEDTRIFMNGYQTWTDSKEYTKKDRIKSIKRIPKFLRDKFSFDRYGDYHFIDYPDQEGVTHGFSYCYFRDGDTYRLFASLDEMMGYSIFYYDANKDELRIEKDCANLYVNDGYSFSLFYAEGKEEEVFDAWFKAMHIEPITKEKIAGYSSWYNRYQNINEACIMQDLNGAIDLLEEGDYFQIDDGWEKYIGDWEIDTNKFPNGLKPIVDKIHENGLKAGLWLAPFVAEEASSLYQNHQDWFLKVNGENWKLGSNWSGFYSLDMDHPEVQEYLKKVFHMVLEEWGFDLVKLDFLYGAAPFGSNSETRAGRMMRANQFLRDLCKEKKILGCGVPLMPSFGIFDYCRISCDVSLDWDDHFYMRYFHRERVSTKNAITSIVKRRQLHMRAFVSDPDVFFLRDKNIKLSESKKIDLMRIDALLGGIFFTSDDISSYDEKKKALFKDTRILQKAIVKKVEVGEHIVIHYELNGEEKEELFF